MTRNEGMTREDYFKWLFRAATGWLGWTPQEALKANMPYIEEAYQGRVDFIQAIFGKPDALPPGHVRVDDVQAVKGLFKSMKDRSK